MDLPKFPPLSCQSVTFGLGRCHHGKEESLGGVYERAGERRQVRGSPCQICREGLASLHLVAGLKSSRRRARTGCRPPGATLIPRPPLSSVHLSLSHSAIRLEEPHFLRIPLFSSASLQEEQRKDERGVCEEEEEEEEEEEGGG